MRKITYTEGFLPCMPQIARRILAAGIYNDRNMDDLQALAAATEAKNGYLNYEVSRADGRVSATMRVKAECNWSSRATDADGNEWLEYRASFDVTWPSHGTTALAQAGARVELYDVMVRLALRLQAEFGDRPLMHLNRTAAQIAETQAKAICAVEALAKDGMMHGLRVGDQSSVRGADGIPVGDYLLSGTILNGASSSRGSNISRKRFQMRVACSNSNVLATVTRLEDAAE